MLFALIGVSLEDCGDPGCETMNSDTKGSYSNGVSASITYSSWTAHWLGIRGSFVAPVTGHYQIQLNGDGFLGGVFKIDYRWTFDGVEIGTHRGDWTLDYDLNKDWRYAVLLESVSSERVGELAISVKIPGTSTFVLLGTNYLERCTIIGCRDLNLSREPWSCQPPPTRSRSTVIPPTPTASPTKTPSASESVPFIQTADLYKNLLCIASPTPILCTAQHLI
jgi:hypothetical protein